MSPWTTCTACGARNQAGSKFCNKCGESIEAAVSSSDAPAETPVGSEGGAQPSSLSEQFGKSGGYLQHASNPVGAQQIDMPGRHEDSHVLSTVRKQLAVSGWLLLLGLIAAGAAMYMAAVVPALNMPIGEFCGVSVFAFFAGCGFFLNMQQAKSKMRYLEFERGIEWPTIQSSLVRSSSISTLAFVRIGICFVIGFLLFVAWVFPAGSLTLSMASILAEARTHAEANGLPEGHVSERYLEELTLATLGIPLNQFQEQMGPMWLRSLLLGFVAALPFGICMLTPMFAFFSRNPVWVRWVEASIDKEDFDAFSAIWEGLKWQLRKRGAFLGVWNAFRVLSKSSEWTQEDWDQLLADNPPPEWLRLKIDESSLAPVPTRRKRKRKRKKAE